MRAPTSIAVDIPPAVESLCEALAEIAAERQDVGHRNGTLIDRAVDPRLTPYSGTLAGLRSEYVVAFLLGVGMRLYIGVPDDGVDLIAPDGGTVQVKTSSIGFYLRRGKRFTTDYGVLVRNGDGPHTLRVVGYTTRGDFIEWARWRELRGGAPEVWLLDSAYLHPIGELVRCAQGALV